MGNLLIGATAGGNIYAPPQQGFTLEKPQQRTEALLSYLAKLKASIRSGHGDMAFLVIAAQVEEQNQRIRASLQNIKLLAAARKQLSFDMDRVRGYRDKLKELNNDSDPNPTSHVWHYNELPAPMNDPKGDAYQKYEYVIDKKSGQVQRRPIDASMVKHNHGPSVDDFDRELKHLEGIAQDLDSDREIEMTMLNSAISKKGNMIQLLSNIDKKHHETEQSVIGNLR